MPQWFEMWALTKSAEATTALAAGLAPCLAAGDVLSLNGDLGAGKTVFAKGLGAALGVTQPITSPTFTLAAAYEGRVRFNHLDVYRLSGPEEAYDLDLGSLFDDGVTLIEWGDRLGSELPDSRLEIGLGYADADADADADLFGDSESPGLDESRLIHLKGWGQSWLARQACIQTAIGTWMVSR